ncbi:MAG: VRR-NUC domain-containing protein [Candidatus Azobacteroides sp.]|nr:VRR-NUC domain-containing protein [Candidatus Azobacteroides sp.]
MRKHPEDSLQTACVKWFRLQYPNHLIHHSPNGGYRNIREAARFKEMGTISGFPDLFIPVESKEYNGLFVELKCGKNKPTNNQLTVMDRLRKEGYLCVVCYCFDEFKETVNNYLS